MLSSFGGILWGEINIKDEAHRLVDQLPKDSTWDDLMHEIYIMLKRWLIVSPDGYRR